MKINKILAALFLLTVGFFSESYFMEEENRNEKKEKVAWRFDTPLHRAAYSGRLKEFERLLGEGAVEAGCVKIPNTDNYEHRDCNGFTLLHWAVRGDNVPVARFLLESGAKVNPVGGDEDATPLHYACENGKQEMIDLLLRFNADTTKRDEYGQAPIAWAFRSEYVCAIHWLGIDFEEKKFDKQQAFLLLTSFAKLNKEEAKAIIEVYPDLIDKADEKGQTPSHWAAAGGAEDYMTILKELGANQTLLDQWGKTAEERLAEQEEISKDMKAIYDSCPDEIKDMNYNKNDKKD